MSGCGVVVAVIGFIVLQDKKSEEFEKIINNNSKLNNLFKNWTRFC